MMSELIPKIDLIYDKDLPPEEVNLLIADPLDKKQLEEVIDYYLENNNKRATNFIYEYLIDRLDFPERESLIRSYFLKKNHFDHDDIVQFFQVCSFDKFNVSILLNAITNIPDYLLIHDDVKYPYIRKIMYAIGAQPEPYNIEALEKLSNETNDEQIKDLALHQIKKRKELGRWESKKNTES